MAALGAVVGLIGTGLSVASSISQGQSAQTAANYSAAIQKQQAASTRASYMSQAAAETEKGVRARSRARAMAAASGAGDSETESVSQTLTDLAKQSWLNASNLIYTGEESARIGRAQADLTQYSGKTSYQQSLLTGLSQGLKGVTSAFYG